MGIHGNPFVKRRPVFSSDYRLNEWTGNSNNNHGQPSVASGIPKIPFPKSGAPGAPVVCADFSAYLVYPDYCPLCLSGSVGSHTGGHALPPFPPAEKISGGKKGLVGHTYFGRIVRRIRDFSHLAHAKNV